jgi:hypothetical protein
MSLIQTVIPTRVTPVRAALAPVKPGQKSRCRNVPLRDDHGELRAIIEVAPSSTPDQRARFTSLARFLHQRWFIDQPSPLWVDGKPPTWSHATINTSNTQKETL